jgi:beta-galactosidase
LKKFPTQFIWGNSISAFEYEMGSTDSINPDSDWYVWVHNIKNRTLVNTGFPEQGPDYWNLFKTDHLWASWLGMQAWRMNPEWSRIFPKPTVKVNVKVEQQGNDIINIEITDKNLRELDSLANQYAVQRYYEIFQDIKEKGMKLILNLHHFTLPIWLHNPIAMRESKLRIGPKGWLDVKTIVEFAKFSAYVAWKFGDLVDEWSTLNEPNVVWEAFSNYTSHSRIFPPGVVSIRAMKQVAYNLVQAHARAYEQIKRIIGSHASVGVIYAVKPIYLVNELDNNFVKQKADLLSTFWFFDSITNGKVRKDFFGDVIERADLKKKLDWIGINYYSRNVVIRKETFPGFRPLEGYGFICNRLKSKEGFPVSDIGWEMYPSGIRTALKLFKYYKLPLIITENGVADRMDKYRTWYTISHLLQVWDAIYHDGIDIRGYMCWTLIDDYEFIYGFDAKFGFLFVDMNSKKRVPRQSAYVFKDIIINNGIPDYLIEYSKYPNPLTE